MDDNIYLEGNLLGKYRFLTWGRNMRKTIYLNNEWKYSDEFKDEMAEPSYHDSGMAVVRIPHTVSVTPFNYFNDNIYQKLSGYRKSFKADESWKDKKVTLNFMGAAHEATVYFNGKCLGTHSCGYTAFSFDISDSLVFDGENIITVKLDSRENLNVPPFGFVVDYMTYGGIYRDVYLEVSDMTCIEDIFVSTEVTANSGEGRDAANAFLHAAVTAQGDLKGCVLKETIKRISGSNPPEYVDEYKDEKEIFSGSANEKNQLDFHTLPVVLWDVENPSMYVFTARLFRNDILIDEKEVRFGFRKAVFEVDGFYLNGRKLNIRGLNRHQSYPYVGYAMPDSMQVEDVRILKEELCVNAVRCSHYPQSQEFINACDEKGIMVFMEFPGWQHIGDEKWKEQALVNEREMIIQYRNHPSIIIWGVRINESADDDEFYTRTNALSHELDPSRQTGGVRAATKMHLLEDVYTYNDFSFDGKKPGCIKKKAATPDMEKGYLVTEYNGHMYPTKSFDDEEHRCEHALRHVKVLDAIAGEEDVAGGFGWCMFDYNTHKDFGAGDRICYHGVMDMFRNPKMAAYVYGSQGDGETILELSSSMDIGEHPQCIRGDIWIFTNADSVKMYKNNTFIKEYSHKDSPFKNLKYGPILVDDFIGDQLQQNEKFSKEMAEKVKRALNTAARYGMGGLKAADMVTGFRMMAFHGMSTKDVVDIYQKYIGDWGGEATSFKFEAIKDGKVVKTLVKETVSQVKLQVEVSHTDLKDDKTYDVAAVRIRAVDQNGNVIPYFAESVKLKTEGAIEVIGPKHVPLRGGMGGTYVKSKRKQGTSGKLIISMFVGEKYKEEISFHIEEGASVNV